MPETKNRILVVDDSTSDIQLMVENLKPYFNLSVAKSGAKALEVAASPTPPDVILLDGSMPDMDGYETCQQLKSNEATKDIDVIFVSANDTTEEKLRGYDVGACDYLIKPLQPEELLQKVRLTLSNRQYRVAKGGNQQIALDAAMDAIQEASEQSIIIDFLRQSFAAADVLELAELICETTHSFGLNSLVQIRLDSENVNASSTGDMTELEKELLYKLKDGGRIIQRGNRLVLNFDNLTQIIKDLPEDEEKAGRLRDHLMLILESADNHCNSLALTTDIRRLISEFKNSLITITELQRTQKLENIQILDNMVEEVNVEFLSCGLTDQQESAILSIISQAVEAGLANFERGVKMDEDLHQLAEQIAEKIYQSVESKEKVESIELF
ncbi:response regulator [Halioxenophilus aromaticivorans]|uniref:Response regulatory domain-containing protein n=1 Tax=Halioxenophilus aromaticivorans TaxID=1306992 RepID=A0AAV3U5T4_9ALTE